MPTARTTLSMSVYKAIPNVFGRCTSRYLTPTVSTLAMGGVSIVIYAHVQPRPGGYVIADSSRPSALDRLLLRPHGLDMPVVLPQGPHVKLA